MGWVERVRADSSSWLLAVMGWEAAGIAPSCPVPSGKQLCGSWRCRLEVMVLFFPSLGCVGMQSPGGWNLSFLLQWLFSGCCGLDFGLWTGCAALGVKDCISWLWVPKGGSSSEGDVIQWLPVSFFLEFKLLKNKSLHFSNKLFTFAFQP